MSKTNKQPAPAVEFPFVGVEVLKSYFALLDTVINKLRDELRTPICWIKPSRKILYNLTLWRHYLIEGKGKSHDRLVEAYLKTIPSARK